MTTIGTTEGITEGTTDAVETINDPGILPRIISDTATEGDTSEQGEQGVPLFAGLAASSPDRLDRPDRPAIDIDADPVTGAPLAAAVLGVMPSATLGGDGHGGKGEPDPVAVAAAIVAQASAELTTGAPFLAYSDVA